MKRSSFQISGNRLTVVKGSSRKTLRFGSQGEAVAEAARIEAEEDAQFEREAAQLRAAVAAGRDVVLPHPDDREKWGLPSAVRPPPVGVGETGTPSAPVSPTPPPSDPDPIDPDPDDPEVVTEPAGQAVITGVRYNAATNRVLFGIATTGPVTLWRRVGEQTATFDLDEGDHTRNYKANVGDPIEFRHGNETGVIVYEGDVPEPDDDTE